MMKPFTLAEIAAACGGQYIGDEAMKSLCITSVERDSRQIQEGSLFLAIPGANVDGHDYIEQCYADGAICAICEKAPENAEKPYILVPSTLEAVKKIGKAYREKFDIPIVGVSGSVGKTSTKEMLYAVISQKYKTHKTQGNLNNELGVPLTLLSMPEDTEAAVIEMGISGFGEMTRLSEMVQPTICVITIIGSCHLEQLGDRDGVCRAKTEMFANARECAEYILNGDDDKLSQITEVRGKKPIFFGLMNQNPYHAKNIKNSGEDGVSCTLCFDDKELNVVIPAIGTYMVSNALAAVAAGNMLGLSSIDTLKNFDGRKVAILGDMKELGADERELHYEIGKYAKAQGIDVIIGVGPLALELAKGAEGLWFDTIGELNEDINNIIKNKDTVLVKASHSMQFEKIVESLKYY